MSVKERLEALWYPSIAAVALSGIVGFAARSLADPDLWGHVRFGQLMRSLGDVTRKDPFSYQSAGRWINHEWLSEIFFSVAWDAAGTAGLVLLKAAVVGLLFVAVYRFLMDRGLDTLRAGVLVVFLFLPVAPSLLTIRPQMFTMLIYTFTLLVLVALEDGRARLAWVLPILTAVWINFHGGVLAGLGILAIWAGVHAVRVLWRERSPVALIRGRRLGVGLAVLAAAVAVLANPYGPDLPLFLLETATVPRPDISEWQPLALRSFHGGVWLVTLVGAAYALIRTRRRRAPALLVLLACTALLPLTAGRHLALFGIAAVILAGPHLASALGWTGSGGGTGGERGGASRPRGRGGDGPEPRSGRLASLRPWIVLLNLAAAVAFLSVLPDRMSCIPLNSDPDDFAYPVESTHLLRESGLEGRLAVRFGWGEYAIWHLHPAILVGMDGRRETVYADSVYDRYLHFYGGREDWDAFLEDPPADFALVTSRRQTDNLLSLSPGWTRVYGDTVSSLYARPGSPSAEHLRRTAEGLAPAVSEDRELCFPGPGGS